MPNPATHLTPFHFYCNSFEELPTIMEENVGYKVKPNDIWSINIEQFELNRLRVNLTIIYWKEKK
jgi:hypothetical protein